MSATTENYPGELAMLRGLLGVLRVTAKHGDFRQVQQLLVEHEGDEQAACADQTEKATAPAATATPTDTNRRAHLLNEMALGGRWKSGDVVRWYERRGLTGLGVRAARHDLAILRDSGAITEHNEKGVRFYTLNSQKGSRS